MKYFSLVRLIFITIMIALPIQGQLRAQSLYNENSFKPLIADYRAFRVGDSLTVQIVESAVATANADTGTSRSNQLAIDLSGTRSRGLSVGAGMSGNFDGGGRTERAGRLMAQLTVSVQDVFPGGDLLIAGEQQLTINNETQRIKLTGRVRPNDISDSNIILSSRIASAEITYVGDGHISDRQKRAWWRDFVDWLGF